MSRVLLIAGAVLIALGVTVGGFQAVQRYQAAVERQQVDQYTAGILPQARLAGGLVSQTIVPMLEGYRQGTVSSGTVAQAAVTWRALFERTRTAFGRVQHPGKLDAISKSFDHALSEYAAAVTYFELVNTPQAGSALRAGAQQAQRADTDYGAAAGTLGCLRKSVSLPAVTQFPASNVCPSG